jgi:hypothetical protein
MNQHLKVAAVAVIATAMTACSSVGSSIPGPAQNGAQSINHGTMAQAGIDPSKVIIMRTREGANTNAQPNAHLTYRNGPVQVKARMYVIYWGFNVSGSDPSNVQTYETAFLNGVAGSSWMNISHPYYEIVGGLTYRIRKTLDQI